MNGELRSTYVDADEAKMLRLMRRYRGDDEAREIGNQFSQANATRIAALAERNAGRPPAPVAPPAPTRLGLQLKTSQRAVPVPRVGIGPTMQRPAPIEYLAGGRRKQPADLGSRPDYSEFQPAALPPYVPPAHTRDDEKERLQDRIAYGDNAPPRDPLPARSSAQHTRIRPSEAKQVEELAQAISREIDERRDFLAEMSTLGKRGEYVAQINGEIAVRQQELKRLEKLMHASADLV